MEGERSVAEVSEELSTLAAELHAGMARLLDLLDEFDRLGGWGGGGARSIGHWASVVLGLDARACRGQLRTAQRLRELPTIAAAMRRGELSYDKVRVLARVATPESAAQWLELALAASTTQLQRIASAYVSVARSDEPPAAPDAHSRRGLWFQEQPDGFVQLLAVLAPEDAALVRAAVDAVVEQRWREAPADDRPAEPLGARRADALVALVEAGLAAGPQPVEGGDRVQVILHADVELLEGTATGGRCQLDGATGPLLPETARRLACDAIIRPLLERAGRPIDVGRARRLVTHSQRRALRARDGGCAFSGCDATRYLDAHHIEHWVDGGRTDLDNLVLLCRFHHRRHHEGVFRIERPPGGRLRFVDARGRPIEPPAQPPPGSVDALRHRLERMGTRPQPGAAAAAGGGARFDLGAAIDCLRSAAS